MHFRYQILKDLLELWYTKAKIIRDDRISHFPIFYFVQKLCNIEVVEIIFLLILTKLKMVKKIE